MSVSLIAAVIGLLLATLFAAIWWLRHSNRGLEWLLLAAPLAFAASYLSSFLFRVAEYQAGCNGICPGWYGHPIATHLDDGFGDFVFDPVGFVLNAAIYYAIIVSASAFVAWLANYLRWPDRSVRWRLAFVAIVVVLPLALTPIWIPPPRPELPQRDLRLGINAARAWRWQLQSGSFFGRRLAVEDVRLHPDGEQHRVCFRMYTWFYIPYRHAYVDLEPTGVRATGGGVIPLNASCWVQP
ncbi:MAG: hypothetical protein J5I90_08225 [Caldilineales bacterium]|nr:hypothetical protein [Caldilineales bacterium]